MGDEQDRNSEPQCKLPKLVGRNPKVAPAIESVEAKSGVNCECRVKDEMPGQRLPRLEQVKSRSLERLDRMNTKCMSDKM